MEFKYYDKSWLPAIKGAFLIIFGIIAMSQILGSIRSLASLFIVLIGMIGIILISQRDYVQEIKIPYMEYYFRNYQYYFLSCPCFKN